MKQADKLKKLQDLLNRIKETTAEAEKLAIECRTTYCLTVAWQNGGSDGDCFSTPEEAEAAAIAALQKDKRIVRVWVQEMGEGTPVLFEAKRSYTGI